MRGIRHLGKIGSSKDQPIIFYSSIFTKKIKHVCNWDSIINTYLNAWYKIVKIVDLPYNLNYGLLFLPWRADFYFTDKHLPAYS